MNLGISLYPDKTEFIQDQEYLVLAKKYGFTRVFMSFLQIDINNPQRSIQRIKESAKYAAQIGMDVDLDIHPMVFKYIKKDESDLSFFHELDVTTLRLDSSYDGKTEAMMTHNLYGIKIEINMSRQTHELERIMDYHPNLKQLCGSHNFYPQRFTALPLSTFKECSKKFLKAGISSAAFITSQDAAISPWPISEGLCTLEDHRDLPITTQFKHMKMMGLVDDVIIGNTYASEDELIAIAKINKEAIPTLTLQLDDINEIERKLLLEWDQEYRGDASEYIIRSTKHRTKCIKENIPPHNNLKDIHRGDILILNEQYGQYKGEVQIALTSRKGDARINVVGRIVEEDLLLMSELQPFQTFRFQEEEK